MSSSQRPQNDTALPDSDELFRSIFEQAVTGIAVAAADGRLLRVNGALCRMLGYSEQELLQRTFQEITHPEYVESSDAFLQLLLSGKLRIHSRE